MRWQDIDESWLMRVVMRSTTPWRHAFVPVLAGITTWPATTIDLPDRVHAEGLIARLEALDDGVLTRDELRDLVTAMVAQSGEGPSDDVAIVVVSRKQGAANQTPVTSATRRHTAP